MLRLEAALEQREEIAAVGAVDDQWGAVIAGAGGNKNECNPDQTNAERGSRNAEQELTVLFRVPRSNFRVPVTEHRVFSDPADSRTADTPPAPPRAAAGKS
jgi:hypothetical protein